TLPQRFLDLARKYPKDAVAVDALGRVVELANGHAFPAGGKDHPGTQALTILLRDHLRSEKLGPACLRLSFGFRKDFESFLRAVLAKSPHKDVRGLACLALGHFLNNRLQRLELIKDRPDQVKRYEGLFGKDYIQDLQRQGHARLARDAEAAFEQAVE